MQLIVGNDAGGCEVAASDQIKKPTNLIQWITCSYCRRGSTSSFWKMIIISCWLVIVVTVRQLPFGLISHSLLLESKSTKKDAQDSNSGIHTNHTKESPWYLLISKNRSIVYIHVRKTGGTTLNGVFWSNCEWYRDGKQGKKFYQSFK